MTKISRCVHALNSTNIKILLKFVMQVKYIKQGNEKNVGRDGKFCDDWWIHTRIWSLGDRKESS
jgi:hypothetical protein